MIQKHEGWMYRWRQQLENLIEQDFEFVTQGKIPCLLLNPLECRLAYARRHIRHECQCWNSVVWPDITKLELCGHMNPSCLWKMWKSSQNKKNSLPKITQGGRRILLLGSFLQFLDKENYESTQGIMNKQQYLAICKNIINQNLSLERHWTYQHVNDPRYTTQIFAKYLNDSKIKVLTYATQRLDLNLIENW